ncbi:calcium/sodium antiporter [Candidatus Woesearchaeota archaeon]|nr:calcium/sodium antiporter [Candidatus Woesearchaeota archaeon]
MIADITILLVSLLVLTRSSDMLLESAVGIAKYFGLTEFFIGTTLVALGTSLPELASSIIATSAGHSTIAIGNILGSNITNITLILGIASILAVIKVKEKYFLNKINYLIAASLIFIILSLDGAITWVDGILLTTLFVAYIVKEKKEALKGEEKKIQRLIQELFGKKKTLEELTEEEKGTLRNIGAKTKKELRAKGIDLEKSLKQTKTIYLVKLFGISLFALAALVASSKFLVSSAVGLAEAMSISEEIIALSLIAFGTSIPELAVTFSSLKKGLSSILIGNLIGSNIANLLLVGGISAMIGPLVVTALDWWFTIPFMIFVTLMFKNYINTKWMSKVFEGVVLLFFYAIFLLTLVLTTGI